jgi:protein arginine kinase activator
MRFDTLPRPTMKCQRCPKQATSHITDIVSEDRFEEHHFCEDCAKKFLTETSTPAKKTTASKPEAVASSVENSSDPSSKQCDVCGIKFVEFRNSGRLGCCQDYETFREELLQLLESIHGESRHNGKRPRRAPKPKSDFQELVNLRQKLSKAVSAEAYEEAARLRDRIKQLEEG